jgi:YfiH family protein
LGLTVRCRGLEETGIVRHGFTTKQAGNMSLVSLLPGETPDQVLSNRALAAAEIGVDPRSLIFGQQVHGSNTEVVGPSDRGRGATSAGDSIPRTDCLCTRHPDVPIAGLFADCAPVLVVDLRTPAVGLAHAGWRGTVGGALPSLLSTMARAFDTAPGYCLVCIGPSIRKCCYRVGEDVTEAFRVAGIPGAGGEHLDLVEAVRDQAIRAGVPPGQILAMPDCTSCSPGTFFSHRASRGGPGRMAAVIALV